MPSEYFNPADHLLDLVSVDPRKSKQDGSQSRVMGLIEGWRGHSGKIDIEERVPAKVEGEGGLIKREKKSTGMIVALPVVLERHWKNLWRQKEVCLFCE